MSHKVKEKKKIDAVRDAERILSMNIGLLSWGILFVALIKDTVQFLLGANLLRDIVIGFIVLFWALLVFRLNLAACKKIPNKENLRRCIDFGTLCSGILFVVETSVFPVAQGIEKVAAIVFLVVNIGLNIWIAVWYLCLSPDRHYKVD